MFNAFISGVTVNAGLNMFRQDWLGLEAYLIKVQTSWVDLHWIVGAGISLAALIWYGVLVNLVPKD